MKKLILLLLFIPVVSQAWTLAQIQENLQVPPLTAKIGCAKSTTQTSYAFTHNDVSSNFLKVGFSPTTNVVDNKSIGNAAITTYAGLNIYYSYGGQNKVISIPDNTYWGNPTSSWRKTDNTSTAFVPSTLLPNNLRLTAIPHHMYDYRNAKVIFDWLELKVTITLPNNNPAHFWFRCK